MGYLTIRFIKVYAVELEDHSKCDGFFDNDCDSYVKLHINGKEVFHTEPRADAMENEIDRVFTSEEIPRDSTLKIEVLDDDGSSFETIMVEQNDIDGFLKKPVRKSPHSSKTLASEFAGYNVWVENKLVTAVFWEDTFNYLNCTESPPSVPLSNNCTSSRLYQNVFTSTGQLLLNN